MTKISLGHHTQRIAFTPGAIWVGYDDDPKNEDTGVFRVDASTNQIVTVLKTGKSAGSVAASVGSEVVETGTHFGTRDLKYRSIPNHAASPHKSATTSEI